jgi:hypothetical protein
MVVERLMESDADGALTVAVSMALTAEVLRFAQDDMSLVMRDI